jgi:iron complex transport system substrate-binding protein
MIRAVLRRTVASTSVMAALGCAAALCAAAGLAPGIRPSPAAAALREHVTVTDDLARRVTIPYPPRRIVSLAPGATAMLVAAGAGKQLIATIEYSGQPDSQRALPKIGTVDAIDMERLIAAKPDVVIVWPNGNNPADIANIERLGIPVYRQEADTLEAIGGSLRRLGRLAGTSRVADRAATALESQLAALRRKYADAAWRPTVLLEVWNRPLYTVGGGELMSDALDVCGARNAFADLPQRAPAIGVGAVIARDPDIIVAAAPPGLAASWLAQWRRFPFLKAVRGGRLLAFEDQRLSELGPGIIAATAALCRDLAALRPRRRARKEN